jgi:hypothetical protein
MCLLVVMVDREETIAIMMDGSLLFIVHVVG